RVRGDRLVRRRQGRVAREGLGLGDQRVHQELRQGRHQRALPRAADRRAPLPGRLPVDAPEAPRGLSAEGDFEGGTYDGWAVVFDLPTGKPLCQTRLHVENSSMVKRKARGFNRKTLKTAILEDFNLQFAAAAQASVQKVAPGLTVRVSTIGPDEWP